MGRFLSPDPLGPWVADPSNPQTWNMYSYGLNNPLTNIDPNGLDCVYFNATGDAAESIDQNSNSGECGANGGDWVNGTTSFGQIQYSAGNDTFNIQSSDNQNSYSTTASAPGSQTNGTTCYGNCDTQFGYTQIPNDALNPYAQGVISQVGLQTGPTYRTVDKFLGQLANTLACDAVGAGAGFKSFAGVPRNMMAGPSPGPSSILRGARSALNVQNTEAAAATASIAAAHIAEPVLARAAEYMIPVAGEALTISQGILALSDADTAYWSCLKQ